MSKFDFTELVGDLQKSMGKDERRAKQFGLGNSLTSVGDNPEDFVVLPGWFKQAYGVLGLPFGKWTQVSGNPDSGKTSLSLLSIKCAQEQGYAVVYIETEGKTTSEDFRREGIDPKGVLTVSTAITEEVFDGVNKSLDAILDSHPDAKVLLVIDSYGNTTSLRDKELDQTAGKGSLVGGAAKSNRLGLGAIAARQRESSIAVLIVNYAYANIGTVGSTNAGGKALEFFCSLIINASRAAWYTRTVKGVKVRAGADVLWRTVKNHYNKSLKDENGEDLLLQDRFKMRISSDGMKPLDLANWPPGEATKKED